MLEEHVARERQKKLLLVYDKRKTSMKRASTDVDNDDDYEINARVPRDDRFITLSQCESSRHNVFNLCLCPMSS